MLSPLKYEMRHIDSILGIYDIECYREKSGK